MKQQRTEYVQVWSVSRCLLLGEKKIPKVYIIISICFSYNTVNVFLEGDRAGSWWKPFIFLDEAGFNPAKRWMRGWEPSCWEGPRTMFSVWPDHPPTECDFEGPHSKISAMGPEFLTTALSAIMVSGPSTVYHLVFTPYSPFLTVTRLRSFSPHGSGRFSIGSSQTSPSSPGHYDVDGNLLPNPQDRVDKNIKCSEEHSSWHFTVGLI